LLVTELWGLGDLALAVPFLRAASEVSTVVLVAKPHAAPILARFAPSVELVSLVAPWTAFRGKYRLLHWPWRALGDTVRELRRRGFAAAASARPDPREHLLLGLSGAKRTFGYPRLGSGVFLSDPVDRPNPRHRAKDWAFLATAMGVTIKPGASARRNGKRILIHSGAGQPVRLWPRERFEKLAASLEMKGWQVEILDDSFTGIERLLEKLDSADRFIGNDSGPGHLAALLGVPTFTIFGPQLPELFAPIQERAQWIEGAPCPYKPCSDYCRFPEPRCLFAIEVDAVFERVVTWLQT
jgi:ADP-heptose:LPS heptosyltransferase